MSEVAVKLLGKNFTILCNPGEEKHITQLIEYLKQRINEVSSTLKDNNPQFIMLMASLLVCDDLFASIAENEKYKQKNSKNKQLHNEGNSEIDELVNKLQITLAQINSLSKRIENI